MNDYISRVVFRYVTLIIIVYGFYVILHGSLSPGGGFGGGTVLAMGVLMYFLIFGAHWRGKLREAPMSVGVSLLVFGAVVEALKFLIPHEHGPVGTPGTLFSGGLISLANFCIGTLVACAILSIIYLLVKED